MDNETEVLPTAAEDLQAMAPGDTIAGGAAVTPDRLRVLKLVGVVTTAVVVGAIGVATLQGSSTASSTANNTGFGGPAGQGGPPGAVGNQQGQTQGQGGFRGPGQGFAARGVAGTVSKVSATSITVAAADGTTTTVKITSGTQVLNNGAQGSVSDLKAGLTVFVHTEGTGSSRFAERIFVGQGFPGGGPGGFGGPPGQDDQTGNGTTRT